MLLPVFTALNVSPLEPIASAEPVTYKPVLGANVDVPNLANTSTLVTAFAGVTLPSAITPFVRTYPANNPLYVAYNLDVTSIPSASNRVKTIAVSTFCSAEAVLIAIRDTSPTLAVRSTTESLHVTLKAVPFVKFPNTQYTRESYI